MLSDEKSMLTIEKYLRDVRHFLDFLVDRAISKGETISYKEHLKISYAPASINSMLAALNSFLRFIGKTDCCVKPLRIQKQMFCREDRELSVEEYQKLIRTEPDTRISLVIQTICGTGIRVSELQYITAEAVQSGRAIVNCKNKMRVIFIPASVQKLLRLYMRKNGIKTGTVFVTRNGKPLNRRNIWRDMKVLCKKAGVSANKVFPHNLRHLFARTFYGVEKDIVCLADLLGHSSIDTTRIYTMEKGEKHRLCLKRVEEILMT